jgi:hypothetical protein
MTCSRLSGPKPEIQHKRRGRVVSTLTGEEVTIGREERWCNGCNKKEIIKLRNDSSDGSRKVCIV